ncbi:MAG: T9SS type A sorting domain-containing protein [Dysgonamonadaceae bacterium]|jgi:hypothetical protein|nr:T9SS type A sorting domain-containing protein [Dysgonamonadaceae bacterium]
MKHLFVFCVVVFMSLSFNLPAFSQDVILNGEDEVAAYVAENSRNRKPVDKLVVSGQVNRNTLDKLGECISAVKQEFRFENLWAYQLNDAGSIIPADWYRLNSLLENIKLEGSIIFRNVENTMIEGNDGFSYNNGWIPNGDPLNRPFPQVVNGDFIWEDNGGIAPDCDGWNRWVSWGCIKETKGDFRIKLNKAKAGRAFFTGDSFKYLERVGGTFKVDFNDNSWTWGVHSDNLNYIGGDLILLGAGAYGGEDSDGNPIIIDDPNTLGGSMWSLDLLSKIDSIGGNVKIVNFPKITWGPSGDDGEHGYCWIRYLIEEGRIDYACHDVILGWDLGIPGYTPYNLDENGGCYNGKDYDRGNNILPLPAKKTPEECGQTSFNPAALAVLPSAFISDNELYIQSDNLKVVELYDLTGKKVLNVQKNSVSVAGLPKGVYIVKIQTATGIQNVKVIK